MQTINTTAGDKLKEQIAQNDDDQKAIRLIDQFLQKKGEAYPYQFTAKAVFELVSEGDSPFCYQWSWIEFLLGLEAAILIPENMDLVQRTTNITEKGIIEGFTNLKRFFAAFYKPELIAEFNKTGLLEYRDRFDEKWKSVQDIITEVQSFK